MRKLKNFILNSLKKTSDQIIICKLKYKQNILTTDKTYT